MLLRNLSRKQTYNDNIYGITRLNLIDSSISYLPFHALVVFWPDFLLKSASIDMVHSFSKIDTDSYISMTAIIRMLCKSKTLKISTNLRVAIMKRSHIVLQRVFQHENCTHPKKLHSYRFQKKFRNYVTKLEIIFTLFPASDSSIDTKHALLSVTHVPYPFLNFFLVIQFFFLNYVTDKNKIIFTLFPASDSSIDTKSALLSVTYVLLALDAGGYVPLGWLDALIFTAFIVCTAYARIVVRRECVQLFLN